MAGMSEAGSRAKEPKRPAALSPPAGGHETRARDKKRAAVADEETIPSNAIKPDHEILAIALRDIDLINSALSTEAPIEKLKSGRNVMAAYRDFMRKGREEQNTRRSWEDNPNDKLFDRGIHNFSQVVQEYSSWSEENPDLAKDYRLSQYLDADPKIFGAKKPTAAMLRKVPKRTYKGHLLSDV